MEVQPILNADEQYPRVVEGLLRVYDSEESSAILDEFEANVARLEQRNEMTYASIRDRSKAAVTRMQTVAFALAAMALWISDHKQRLPAGALLTGVLGFAAVTTAAAIVFSLQSDGAIVFQRVKPEAFNPFLRDETTAKHRDAYRLWVLPARFDAALDSKNVLSKSGRKITLAQNVGNVAIFSLLAFSVLLAMLGVTLP